LEFNVKMGCFLQLYSINNLNIIYRKWSTVDGKCQKIFRGHRDTILCIEVLENVLCTGSKDASCKSE